ncbi:MAG: hypothetical protein OSJ70_03570 [Bacilli bacterium]|nr:hypothetical protein [Bacilli bacterium]
MAVCTNCGASYEKIGRNCPYCHTPVALTSVTDSKSVDKYTGDYDSAKTRLMVFSVIISSFGYIYYFINRENYPLKSNSALSGALVGTVIKLAIIIIVIIATMIK